MGFFSTLFGRSAATTTTAAPSPRRPVAPRSAERLDLPAVPRGLAVQGMYYSRRHLAEVGGGEFDATLGVRYQEALGGEITSHVVNVLVNGREVGWIHRDEHLLGFVRGIWEEGKEPHARVRIERFSGADEGREWYASLLIPQLPALNDAKTLQEGLKAARKGRSRKATASISTEPESSGKYAGQAVYVFSVDGVVIGTRRPRWGVEGVDEAFDLGVREAVVVIEGEPGTLAARATMARRPD